MNLPEIRKQYPQYNDLTDQELAEGLHKKFYSDLDFEDFSAKVGYQPDNPTDEHKLEMARRQYGQDLPSRGYVGETLHSLGTMFTDTIPKATAQMIQGSNVPASDESGLLNRFIAEQDRDLAADIPSKEYILGKGAHRSIVEGIQGGGASLPVSLAGFGTGLAAGAALPDPTPFGRIAAGTGAAMATSGAMMYRMAKNEFLRQVRDSLIKKQGQLDPAEWEGIKNEIDSQATQYGIWEAGPEALSEGLEFLIFKAPIGKALTGILGKGGASKILNNTLARVGGKYVGMLGAEVPTEAFTQVGQKQLLAEQGIGEQPKGGFASQYGQALKEVAGPTAVTTAMLGGGYKALDMIGGKKPKPKTDKTATETDTAAEPTKSAVDQQKAIENLKQGLHAGKISIDEAISWKPAFEKEGIPSATVDQVIAEYKKATGKKSIDEQLDNIFGAEPQKKVVEEPPTVSEKTEIKEPITFPHEQTAQMSKEVMEFDRKRKVAKAKKFKEDFATEEEGGIGVSEIEAEMAAKTAEKSRLAKEQEAQHLHGKRAALSRDAESLITFAKTYTSELSIPQEVKWDLEKRIEKAKMGNPEALQYLYDRFKTTPEFEASEPPEIRIAKEQADLKAKIEADKAEKKATKPEVETEIIPESVVDRINEQRPELGLVYQGIQPGAGKAPASHQFYFTEPNSGRHPNIGVVDLTEENLLKTIDDKIEEFRQGQEKLKAKKVKAKEKPPETKPEAAGETISDKGIGEPSQPAVGRAWVNNQFRPIIQAREIKRGKNKGKVQVVLPGGKSRMVEAKDVREWPGEKKGEAKPEATKAEAEKTQFSTRLDTAISKGASRIATNEIARRTTERRSGDRRREVFNERYGRAPERRIGIERRKPSVTETAKDRIAEYGANLLKKQALDNLAFFKQVKASFPKQTVKNNGDGTFTVATRYGEKYTVKSVKQIAENKASFEIAYGRPKGTAERIAGAYHPSTATIEIVKGVGDKWTLSHESYHLIKNLGKVTIGESKAINSRIRADKKDPAYKPTEEDQARWIEKALQERDKYRGTTIGKVLQRLGDLIDSFVNLFHATSRSVLRGMESGEIYERGGTEAKNQNILYQVVHHGTMHIWPPEKGFPHGRPRLDKVGSGEGGAAFGFGFYMADAKETAITYRQIILDDYHNVLLDGSVATVDRMAEAAKDIIGSQRVRSISKDALSRIGRFGSVEVAIQEIEGLQADKNMRKYPDVLWELAKQKELIKTLGNRIKTTGEFGTLYTLDIPDGIIPKLLDWDKKVSDTVLDKIEMATKNKPVLDAIYSIKKDNHFKLKPNLRSKYALPEVLRIIKNVGFTEGEITLVLENDGKSYEALTKRFPDLAEEEDWAENVVLDVWGVTSIPPPKTGGDLYNAITRALDGNQQEASEIFRKAGIPGNKYLDQFSREKGEGSYNYVIWDQKVLDKIALLERNGVKLDAIREMADQANTGIQYSTKLDPKLQALFDKSMSQPEGKGKSWLNRETGYMIKNIIQLLPRNHPALGFWEQLLKSPEWWDHENVQKIVKHAIERHDLFSENFNELIEDPLGGEGSLLENIQALKHKGLTFAQKMTGKTSKEYIDLMNMLDEGDAMTGPWNADKTAPVAERVALFEQYQRSLGISEETIRVWKSIRSAMDNALDKMIAPMVAILEKKKEEAAFAGKSKQEIEDVDIPEFINVFDEYKQEVNKKSLKEVIAEMESWRGFYAPRIRKQGKWAIRAKRGSGDFEERFFDMAPTRGSAERLADSIRKEGYTDVKISLTKRLPEEVYQHVSVMATEELLKKASEGVKLDDSSILAKFQEQLIQQTADIIRVRGYRGSMVHRKDGEAIRGYINDPLERTSRYLANTSAGLAKAETAARMVKELAKIDAATESNAYAAAQRYIEEQLRNADSTDRVIGIAKSVATFKYLGLPNIRAPFVNLTAMLTTAPAALHQYVLKGKGNFAEVFAALGKAGKDYARFMTKGKTHNMSTDETVFMNEIKSKNYDDPQYTRDALGTIQALHGKAFTKAMNGSMWLFGKTEQWNRGATLLAAYRLAKKHGMTNAEAQEAAVDATGKAHGVYGKSTLPAWAQGKNPFSKIAQMAYTYQKFGHNWLQMCYDLGLKKKNIRAFVWAMASPIVLGGAAAIPLKTAVMSMVGFLLKSAGEDRDPEKYVWDTINEHIGPTTEKALRYGIVGLGGKGVDVSGSFSVDPGVPKNMIELTGAIGGVVGDLGEVMHQFMAGKPLRGLEALLPAGASSMIKAARESEEGASTRWGNKIFDERNRPYMPTMGETTLRAMGFRSSRRSTVQAKQWEQKKEVANFRKRQSMIYEKLKAWQMQKPDREKLKEILEEIFEYNKNVVESGNYGIPLITKQSIRGINRRQAIPDKAMRAIKY